MPLPRLGRGATIAAMSGLCISSKTKETERAADFLTEVISDEGASTLAATGYVMPANLDVLNDDVFLQSGQRPLHADVFAREVRDTRLLPSTPRWPLVKASSRATADAALLRAGDPAARGAAGGDRRGVGPDLRPLEGHSLGQPVARRRASSGYSAPCWGVCSGAFAGFGSRIAVVRMGAVISICQGRAPRRASSSADCRLHVRPVGGRAASTAPAAGSRGSAGSRPAPGAPRRTR